MGSWIGQGGVDRNRTVWMLFSFTNYLKYLEIIQYDKGTIIGIRGKLFTN